jgi:hypothetical protein
MDRDRAAGIRIGHADQMQASEVSAAGIRSWSRMARSHIVFSTMPSSVNRVISASVAPVSPSRSTSRVARFDQPRPVPRQQLVEAGRRMIGNARQHVGEPGTRIEFVQFGGDDVGRPRPRAGSLA